MCGKTDHDPIEETPETVAAPAPNLFADLPSVFSPKIGRSPDFETPDAVATIANETNNES